MKRRLENWGGIANKKNEWEGTANVSTKLSLNSEGINLIVKCKTAFNSNLIL
jgi:hypothetical protein